MKDEVNEKAKKQIAAIIIIGSMLIIADLIAGVVNTGVPIVQSDGKLYLVRPEEGKTAQRIVLEAQVRYGGEEYRKKYDISIEPYSSVRPRKENAPDDNVSGRELAEYEMRSAMGALNGDLTKKRVELPTRLKTVESISWYRKNETNTLMICMLMVGALAAVWHGRMSAFKKEEQNRKNSIMRQLPEFVNRLVLLLNAGLVLNTAFEKNMEESVRYCKAKDDYFYSNMTGIYESVKHANASMSRELRRFAKESGVKELMRVSNIISDNVNKGVELNEKLERESEMLWIVRKKTCEERGRLAETKLTLPLMLFLMVLIVITVSPALLEL